MNTIAYLLNLLLTKALKRKASHEVWFILKTSIKNLKVFGCTYFSLVLKAKKDKLDQKTKECIS